MSTVKEWRETRLKNLFTSVRNGVWGTDPDDETEVFCARGTDFDRTANRISAAKMPRRSVPVGALRDHQLGHGDLVLEKSGGSADQPVGSVALFDLEIHAVCSNFNARMQVSRDVDPPFACYLMNSLYWSGFTRQFVQQTTGIQNLDAQALLARHCTLPPLDEQRRIANFLDAGTAQIDRIMEIRKQQAILTAQRFSQLVDGVVMGEADALAEIGYGKDAANWNVGKIARLFSIIPGFAFSSNNFVEVENGTRLLRGINIAPGRIDWGAEVVAWNLESSPIEKCFYMRLGDLVIGMDRPWINGGVRIALIREIDLPCLLLQRVACIRSRSASSTTRYLRWVLGSGHFRSALEGETTGVSVPHISGDQIGSFTYRSPSPDEQELLADLLQSQDDLLATQAKLVDRQLTLLAERRQALITAAVTGQIDVTTARGVSLSGGVAG